MTSIANIQIEDTSLEEIKVDLLVIPVADLKDLKEDDLKGVKKATRIKEVAKDEGFKANEGQLILFRAFDALKATRVLFVGLGEKQNNVRASLVKAIRKAHTLKAKNVAVYIPEKSLTREIVEGLHLGNYVFDKFKTNKDSDEPYSNIESFTLLGSVDKEKLEIANAYATGIIKARNFGNEPPNHLYPESFAKGAVEIAKKYDFESVVLDEKILTEKGFNLLMAVGRGCVHQPRLIHLTYKPSGKITKKIALVGKGITFDTGGYDLKTGGHILNMHLDMGGAAAVFGAAEIIGQLKPKGVEVHFIVPAAQNSISNDSYLPNDIIKGYGGQTVEIQNTDAEGRLVLADALTYAQEQNVDEIIDLATLTGAIVVALGNDVAALYTDSESMRKGIQKAAKQNDEYLWHMPLHKQYDKQLDSKVADMRNIGERWGGSITAALFLKRWVKIENWAHIDLAGPAMADSASELSTPGGTGYGAALLAQYICAQQD